MKLVSQRGLLPPGKSVANIALSHLIPVMDLLRGGIGCARPEISPPIYLQWKKIMSRDGEKDSERRKKSHNLEIELQRL